MPLPKDMEIVERIARGISLYRKRHGKHPAFIYLGMVDTSDLMRNVYGCSPVECHVSIPHLTCFGIPVLGVEADHHLNFSSEDDAA